MKQFSLLHKTNYALVVFALLVLLGKFLGFFREIVISSVFGSDYRTDAFFVANSIPSLIFLGLFSTVSLVFLPYYNKLRIKEGVTVSSFFASNVLNTYAVISLLLSCLGVFFADELVNLIAPSFNSKTYELSVQLTRILCLSFVFSISSGILVAIQNVERSFLGPQLIPLINNSFVIIFTLVLAEKVGVSILAYSSVLAWAFQTPLQYILSRNYFNYRLFIKLKDKNLHKMAYMILPAFVGISIDQLNFLIDNNLGSRLIEGSISALNYSSRLINFFSGLFVIVIVNLLYPRLSDKIVNSDTESINRILNSGIRILILIAFPVTVISSVMRFEIVNLVYVRGAFGFEAAIMTSNVFLFYAVGLVFILLRELNNKIFYANLDTKSPLYISVFAIILNLLLSIFFVNKLGVSGLAFATTLSVVFYVASQFVLLARTFGTTFLNSIPVFVLILCFAGTCMSLTMFVFNSYLEYHLSNFWKLLFSSSIGLSVFFLVIRLLRISEVYTISRFFKKMLNTLRNRA